MTTFAILGNMDFVATVSTHAVWTYFSFPAFKRTRHPGFLLWSIAAILGLWNTVTMHTIGADLRGNPQGYHFVHYSYRIIFLIGSVVSITGTVMLIQSYLRMFDALREPQPPES